MVLHFLCLDSSLASNPFDTYEAVIKKKKKPRLHLKMCVRRMRDNGCKLKEERFKVGIGENLFTPRTARTGCLTRLGSLHTWRVWRPSWAPCLVWHGLQQGVDYKAPKLPCRPELSHDFITSHHNYGPEIIVSTFSFLASVKCFNSDRESSVWFCNTQKGETICSWKALFHCQKWRRRV